MHLERLDITCSPAAIAGSMGCCIFVVSAQINTKQTRFSADDIEASTHVVGAIQRIALQTSDGPVRIDATLGRATYGIAVAARAAARADVRSLVGASIGRLTN